jgi:hypothetical protein
MTIVGATVTLVERDGVTGGRLDVLLRVHDRDVAVDGIAIDNNAAARNDQSAITFPAAIREALGDDIVAAIAEHLVPEIRLLTRRRVIPLGHVFAFDPPAD